MNTKYLFGALLCGSMAVGLSSCDNEDFLDVDQYNVIAPSALYEKDDNAKKGLTASTLGVKKPGIGVPPAKRK